MRIAVLLLILTLAQIATAAAQPQSGQVDRLPNILFIVSDDHGWGDLPSNWDKTEMRLPTLEALAAHPQLREEMSFERANLTFDGKKGSLYKDVMNAVAKANRISKPEFFGFVWKQGAADGTKKVLANDYYDTFKQLVSDLRSDLHTPDLPVFFPSYMNDDNLLKTAMAKISDEDLCKIKNPAGKPEEKKAELLKSVLSYLNELSESKLRKMSGMRPYFVEVIASQNRAGREIPNVATIYPGELPKGADGTHDSAAGYITLGKFTASAVQEFYKTK